VKHRCNCCQFVQSAILLSAALGLLDFSGRITPAQAKQYKVIEPDKTLRRFEPSLNPLSLKGKFDAGEEDGMVEYYEHFLFPTWTDPRSASLPELRKKLRLQLILAGRAPSQDVHDRLNAVTLEYMNAKLANDSDIHPAVRVNAMLMIGELNAVESPPAHVPQPLPEALPVLLKNINDPKQLDEVKAAAMVGVMRHATLGISDPDHQKQVVASMLKVLKTPVTPGQAADGQAWIQGQAAHVLGRLGTAGEGGAVATALAAVAGDTKAPSKARCSAAEALGQLNYSGGGGDAGSLLSALGQLALDDVKFEDSSLLLKRLQARLKCVHGGLRGVLPILAAANRQTGDALNETVEKLLKLKVTGDAPDATVTDAIKSGRNELEQLLQKASK
jgi:hypothetical protein